MKPIRILSAALAGLMLLSCTAVLGGCRKKQVVEKATVDHVYRVTTLEKPEGMNYARQLFVSGERIYMNYMYSNTTDGYTVRENRTYSMSFDGTDLKQEEVPALSAPEPEDENTNINLQQVVPAADGSVWRVLYYSKYDRKAGVAE